MKPSVHLTLAALALCAAVLAALARSPLPPLGPGEISAVQLAEWIRAQRSGVLLLDMRSAQAMARESLPGARPVAAFDGESVDTVVLYGERQLDGARPLGGSARHVLRLRGGIEAWNAEVLFPVIRSDASTAHRREFAARAQLSRYFGGTPRVLEPGARAERNRSRRGC